MSTYIFEEYLNKIYVRGICYKKDLFTRLLTNGHDPNMADPSGRSTYLLQAIGCFKGCDYELVKLLIACGADVDAKGERNHPTELACREGHFDVARLLIENDADVNAATDDGYCAVVWTIIKNNPEFLSYLIKKGADLELGNHRIEKHAIHLAANRGHIKILDCLLDHGIPIDLMDDGGNTALHGATNCGRYNMVAYLIEHGADMETKNKTGDTPIFYSNTPKMVQFLLDNGADIEAKNGRGNTPLLDFLDWKRGRMDIDWLKVLLKNGANINAKNTLGNSALHLVCSNPNKKHMAYILIMNGADVNAVNNKGETPLGATRYIKSDGMPFLLCYYGADPTIKNNSGKFQLKPRNLKRLKDCNDKEDYIKEIGEYTLPSKDNWVTEEHALYSYQFQTEVKQMMLMHYHDQYDEDECNGIRWNELPWEVVENIIRERAKME